MEYLGEITVAPITSRICDIPTEVVLSKADGLPGDCAVNCDHLQAVSKSKIGPASATLPPVVRWQSSVVSRRLKGISDKRSLTLRLDLLPVRRCTLRKITLAPWGFQGYLHVALRSVDPHRWLAPASKRGGTRRNLLHCSLRQGRAWCEFSWVDLSILVSEESLLRGTRPLAGPPIAFYRAAPALSNRAFGVDPVY